MKNDGLRKLRNIGIIAHIDAGKTTVTERVLLHTGLIHRLGNVDDGNTVTDFMVQEQERGITIQSAAITTTWAGYQINLIDTPGHIDFTAEVQRALRVLDGGVVVFDAVAGVEPQSETVWRQADRYKVPRIAFVNKMDRAGADMRRVAGMVRTRLHGNPIIIQMPVGNEDTFSGVIDLVKMQAVHFEGGDDPHLVVAEIPAELLDESNTWRDQMIESLADLDDDIAMAYLDGQEITQETLVATLRRVTINGKGVPMLCGSALRSLGVQPLLDAIVDYLPSPFELPAIVGHSVAHDGQIVCNPDPNEPMAALLFKISTDPYVGKLSFFRVYSGVVRRGDTVYNPVDNRRERIGRLVRMHADRREEVEEISAGDIGAVLGFKAAKTGQTFATNRGWWLSKRSASQRR